MICAYECALRYLERRKDGQIVAEVCIPKSEFTTVWCKGMRPVCVQTILNYFCQYCQYLKSVMRSSDIEWRNRGYTSKLWSYVKTKSDRWLL